MSTSKIFFLTIALLLVCSFTQDVHEHGPECHHDKQEHAPEFLSVDEDLGANSDERLLASSYPKIRFYSHFDLLKSGSSTFKSYIKYDLVPAVIDYLESAIRIKYPIKSKLKVDPSVKRMCGDPTPKILTTTGVSADYFFYFTSGYESSNFVAVSTFCYLSTDTKRPIVSKVKFNINLVEVPYGDALIHERNTYLLMHEMIHSLGFSNDLFKYFVDERGVIRKNHIKSINLNGSTRKVLDVPAITNRVRKHFGCSSAPGAYLENNGDSRLTAGSHFERKHFLMDAMTSGSIPGRRISEFSLAVLESSGWYLPDYSYAEPFHYGAGQGCGFINNKCPSSGTQFEEFCGKKSERGCFAGGSSGGVCSSDDKSDGCKYYVPTYEYDCENPGAEKYTRLGDLQVFGRGSNSKCFSGDLSSKSNDNKNSFCFRYDCNGSGSGTQLVVQVGNRNIACKKQGKVTVPGYKGTIDCPDPLTFCKTVGKKYCPRNCMGRGSCQNGKCACQKGFKGVDCSLRI